MEWRLFNTAILFFENASMGIITQGIEKITCRWDSTLNMVKYNHNMRLEVYSMKKLFKVFSLMLVVIMAFPFSVMASENDQQRSDCARWYRKNRSERIFLETDFAEW